MDATLPLGLLNYTGIVYLKALGLINHAVQISSLFVLRYEHCRTAAAFDTIRLVIFPTQMV
jgi:hypothetical protein